MRLFPRGRMEITILAIELALIVAVTLALIYFCTSMPGSSHTGPMKPLTRTEDRIRDNLRAHVEHLANTIGVRNLNVPGSLELSTQYLAKTLSASGYSGSNIRLLPYEIGRREALNIEVEIPGNSRPDQIVIVGAHYDTVPHTSGANDNASGVAAVLELARMMRGRPAAATIRFVLFANEEPPYFQTPLMGSYAYARELRRQEANVTAMLSLETIGYYTDEPHSQKYPFPLNLLYPGTGDFIAFVGDLRSRGLVRRSARAFREAVDFPSEGAAIPRFLPGVDWSDHWSFREHGYSGIMVTDTAPYRYAHYHLPGDTPGRLDYHGMARVLTGLESVIRSLANE